MTNEEIEQKYSIKYLGELSVLGQTFYSVYIDDKIDPKFDKQKYEFHFEQYFKINKIKSKNNLKQNLNIFVVEFQPILNSNAGAFISKEDAIKSLNSISFDINLIKNNIENLPEEIMTVQKYLKLIKPENLKLIDNEENNREEYILEKLYHWQQKYNWIEWNQFLNHWHYCNNCNGYNEGQCICYAR